MKERIDILTIGGEGTHDGYGEQLVVLQAEQELHGLQIIDPDPDLSENEMNEYREYLESRKQDVGLWFPTVGRTSTCNI